MAVKLMKLPQGFADGERSFFNAAHIQKSSRTRLTSTRMHKLF